MAERSGQQLGNYRLVRRLGRGGVAEVYLGEHVFLNTQAAIKVLQTPLSEQEMPAFLREARTIAALVHPHIVRVLDFGVQDETFYLVMEYAPRGTLRQNYPLGTRLSLGLVVTLVGQVASALQYAHDRNIIHCDVKPENILLSQQNTALLSDFGISLVLQTMNAQQAQYIAGTVAYMAPEQFNGKPQRASDQYALAVMVYEWLSGERLFQGNFAAISSQHLYVHVAPVSSKVPGLPPQLDLVLSRAMEKDPARRFETIRAFAEALEQACRGVLPQDISGEAPTLLATLASGPTPALSEPGNLLAATLASGYDTPPAQRVTEPDNTPNPYRIPLAPEQLPPERRTADGNVARRAFLIGIGGGAIAAGVGVVLLVAGRLFAPGSAPASGRVGKTTPGATARQTPVQRGSPSTSNVPLGATLTTYTGQSLDVTGVCWSPIVSSRMVASCSQDGSAASWSATTSETIRTFSQSSPLSTVAWSLNGLYLAVAGDASTVEIWDATNGNHLMSCTGHTKPVRGLAWSPDSQRLVSTSEDNSAIVWNPLSGAALLRFTRHTAKVWVAAWAPDGGAIATGSWDNTVQIWNPDTGSLSRVYTASQPVRAVDWSPDSSMVASGGDDAFVQVWQAASGNVLTVYRGHSDHIEAVQWSRDGQRIASASRDSTAQIWHAADASQIYTYRGHSQIVWTLAWSPDGQLIVTGSGDRTAKVWQAT